MKKPAFGFIEWIGCNDDKVDFNWGGCFPLGLVLTLTLIAKFINSSPGIPEEKKIDTTYGIAYICGGLVVILLMYVSDRMLFTSYDNKKRDELKNK